MMMESHHGRWGSSVPFCSGGSRWPCNTVISVPLVRPVGSGPAGNALNDPPYWLEIIGGHFVSLSAESAVPMTRLISAPLTNITSRVSYISLEHKYQVLDPVISLVGQLPEPLGPVFKLTSDVRGLDFCPSWVGVLPCWSFSACHSV